MWSWPASALSSRIKRPDRIDDLASIIATIKEQPQAAERFPEGFFDVWDAIALAKESRP